LDFNSAIPAKTVETILVQEGIFSSPSFNRKRLFPSFWNQLYYFSLNLGMSKLFGLSICINICTGALLLVLLYRHQVSLKVQPCEALAAPNALSPGNEHFIKLLQTILRFLRHSEFMSSSIQILPDRYLWLMRWIYELLRAEDEF
jgi:hypothetical protein